MVKMARNAIFDAKKVDVAQATDIPGKSVAGQLFRFCASAAAS
jgi:hypothetical protein